MYRLECARSLGVIPRVAFAPHVHSRTHTHARARFQAFRDGLDSGSFREGLEGLRSDLLNKAVQHRALAKNISSDVLEPLSELKGQLGSKTKALVRATG